MGLGLRLLIKSFKQGPCGSVEFGNQGLPGAKNVCAAYENGEFGQIFP